LSARHPVHSLQLLLDDRSWLLGFAMESAGFLLYAAALSLGSLALVQSIGAGGIGVLAYLSAHMSHRQLSRRELSGVIVSVVGLLALGVSLAGGSSGGRSGSTADILVWLGASGAVASPSRWAGAAGVAVATAVAAGLSSRSATSHGVTPLTARIGFLVTLILGYALGTALPQRGYQAGGAVAVASAPP
jgi:hypothetical protein